MFGCVSPTRANHVLKAFKGQVPVLNGGICEKGLESTIVRPLTGQLIILRVGSLTEEEIQQFLTTNNMPCTVSLENSRFVPGGQKSHYAPPVPLYILEHSSRERTDRFLKEKFPDRFIKYLDLNSIPELAARSLYDDLWELSQDKNAVICVQKTQDKRGGLWDTIWDRLEKAATEIFKLP